MEAMPGMYMVASRAAVEATFKNTERVLVGGLPRARQRAAAHPAERRPAAPPQVPQDPRPDLRAEARWTRSRTTSPRASTTSSTSSMRRGECHFTDEFAEQFPSAVFLGLMGLPWEELDTFLRLKDGIIRPGAHRHGAGGASADPARHRPGALRVLRRHPRRAARSARRTTSSPGSTRAEIDGEQLTRDEILDICFLFLIAGLDTVTDSLTCFFAFLARAPRPPPPDRGEPRHHPERGRGAAALGDAGAERAPHGDDASARSPATRSPQGSFVLVNVGAANVDPAEYADPMDVRFDREVNRHLAFGGGVHRCLGSHLARRELRVTLREWHRRIPEYSIKPGVELHVRRRTPPGREPGAGLADPVTAEVVERRFQDTPALELRSRRAARHLRPRRGHDRGVAAVRAP